MDVAVVVLDGFRQVWWRLVVVVSLRAGKKNIYIYKRMKTHIETKKVKYMFEEAHGAQTV